MITATDSSVILDVLTNDPRFAEPSERCLREAHDSGQLIVSECVLAEIRPAFRSRDEFDEFLNDWQLDFIPSSQESAVQAGEHFASYLERGGKSGRELVDFLIGAHALAHAERLLARDRGFLRDYFSGLDLLDPTSP
jgi:predicted nucleic acid-binding protein